MLVNGVQNGVQNVTFRYHYKNSQVDYTHKDKKKVNCKFFGLFCLHANHTWACMLIGADNA